MMKRMKANDGYALGFVLIVLVVLCTIAIGVSAISLNNLKNQQRSIDRMTAKYEAQGLIEQVVAQLETTEGKSALEVIETLSNSTEFPVVINTNKINETPSVITVTAALPPITVKAELELEAKTKTDDATGTAVITGYTVKYTSYSTEVTS